MGDFMSKRSLFKIKRHNMHQNYNSISQKIYETSFIVCNPNGKYYFCSDLYP